MVVHLNEASSRVHRVPIRRWKTRCLSKATIPTPVGVAISVQGDAQSRHGRIARMSLAGVEIETPHPLEFGSDVAFFAALDPRSSEVLEFKGRVQWAEGSCVGVQFRELGARETHAILQAMRP
jgi:hypothetical protein